ncbi:MAG: GYF domain-containing protein [Planctomycetaceae bacterium]|nr:GYF domain-containing protein [Planctomycetaceae bacterium]
MDWYYANGGVQSGPVSQETFQSLVDNGTITVNTLVWRQGMANWQTWSALQASESAAQSSAEPPRQQLCSRCGLYCSSDDMIQYQGRWICATCKPAFIQQVQEGAPVAPPVQGPWAMGERNSGYAVASLVLGILAIPTCLCYGLPGVICGILAVVFSSMAQRQIEAGGVSASSAGLAKAGKICGWIGLGLSLVAVIGIVIAFVVAAASHP